MKDLTPKMCTFVTDYYCYSLPNTYRIFVLNVNVLHFHLGQYKDKELCYPGRGTEKERGGLGRKRG